MKYYLALMLFVNIFALPLTAQERGSSAPFISGDSFRAISDFTYDELSKDLDPALVKSRSIVFVKTDYLEEFFTNIHPHIPNPYILLTHNSDHHVPGKFADRLDDPKVIAWFGQNVDNYTHPKLHPIPIGIANRMWGHGKVETFQEMLGQVSGGERRIPLYLNFSPGTYLEERSKVVERFKDQPYCVTSEPQKNLSAYLADLAQTKFVLSPRGNGLDCHRTWESLLMGAIPIVRTSALDPMYENLPVVIVKDWSEIDEGFLNRTYEEMKSHQFQWEKIYFAFWADKIRSFTTSSAVTNDLGGGRFGDKLIGYLHAKWISYRYGIPLLYQPFPYSEQLALHLSERRYEASSPARFETTIQPSFGKDVTFQNKNSALYVIPYFPEAMWEHTPNKAWYYFAVDWNDSGFKQEIQKLISPLYVVPDLQLPKDRISVAVHMRLGGGFDAQQTKTDAPLKLPPLAYYKEEIRHIYELLNHKPLYVYIFTDDNEPAKLLDECREFTKDLDIEYGCRSEGNAHDSNVIKDFFEMTKFDCLIRAESNFSIVAAKISDFLIEISPAHFTRDADGSGRVDQVDVKYGSAFVHPAAECGSNSIH